MKLKELINLMDDNEFIKVREDDKPGEYTQEGGTIIYKGRVYNLPLDMLDKDAYYFSHYFEKDNAYRDGRGIEIWVG